MVSCLLSLSLISLCCGAIRILRTYTYTYAYAPFLLDRTVAEPVTRYLWEGEVENEPTLARSWIRKGRVHCAHVGFLYLRYVVTYNQCSLLVNEHYFRSLHQN